MADETTTEVTAPAEAPKPTKQRSYFFGPKVNRYVLSDEVSYIEHQPMDEGVYEAFQDLTSTIKLDREGETTELDMALGRTRKFLLDRLVTGWNLVDESGEPLPFTGKKLKDLPPHIIGKLVRHIYECNPILSSEDEDEAGKEG